MTSRADTEFLLSDEYNPADESLFRFRQSYSHLVRYHDSLQEQRNAKEQKRADMYKAEPSSTAFKIKGSRFSSLLDDENGSAVSVAINHKFAASLTSAQVDKLPSHERMAEVAKIKRDIHILKDAKKEKRVAESEKAKDKGHQAEAEFGKKKDQDEVNGCPTEESKSEDGQHWEKVKRSNKR